MITNTPAASPASPVMASTMLTAAPMPTEMNGFTCGQRGLEAVRGDEGGEAGRRERRHGQGEHQPLGQAVAEHHGDHLEGVHAGVARGGSGRQLGVAVDARHDQHREARP